MKHNAEIGNIRFFKNLLVLSMFIFIFHLHSKAQNDYRTLKMDNNGCNYIVQIDTALLDSTRSYKLAKFSIRGLSKRDTKKLREKMPIRCGTLFLLDSFSILTTNSNFCLVKRWKLEKVQYNYNYYNVDGILAHDGIVFRFYFKKLARKEYE